MGKTNRKDFVRGYGYQGGGGEEGNNLSDVVKEMAYGPKFKESILEPGSWTTGYDCFGEILPYHDNKMFMDFDKKISGAFRR